MSPPARNNNQNINFFGYNSPPNASLSNNTSPLKYGFNASLDMTTRNSALGVSDSSPAHNWLSWVYTTWEAASCIALWRPGFNRCCGRENMNGLEPPLQKSSSKECWTQMKLDELPPLGRHILLCVSQQSPLKGHVLVHQNHVPFCCKCTHSFSPDGRNDLDLHASSVGIFLHAYAKDIAKFANRLNEYGQTKRRHHTPAFARLWGEPGMISFHPEVEFETFVENQQPKEPQLQLSPLVFIQRLCLTTFKEAMLHVAVPQQDFPDKEMLDSVQDFFHYTEFEGRGVFEELDRDADGKLTMDDLKVAMKRMKLPVSYADHFMARGRRLPWPMKSFGWSDFSLLIQEKEPLIIQLFNSLGVSDSGTVRRTRLKDTLTKVGISPTEANVSAMMKFLAADTDGYIKYGQFRRFMLLLPTEQLILNPWNVWLNAATSGGVEASSKDLRVSVWKYISLLSRDFTHQFEVAKG